MQFVLIDSSLDIPLLGISLFLRVGKGMRVGNGNVPTYTDTFQEEGCDRLLSQIFDNGSS